MSHSSVNVAKVAKAAPADQKQVFRLTDMEVEEVSLVDRAANKKKFIVVKKESDPMSKGTEVTPNGKGGFTTTPSGATNKKTTAKAAMEVPPGFKEAATPLLDKAVAMIEDLSAQLKGSTPAEITDDGDMPGVPADFSNASTKICDLLTKLSSMWPTAPATDPEDDPAQGGDGGADEGSEPPSPSDMQMRLAEKALVDSAALLKRADVKKIGAKMSKDRLTRLQQAAQVLTNLIGELGTSEAAPAPGAEGAPALGKAKAPPMPPAKGKDDEEEKKKAAEKASKTDEALLAIGKALEGLGQVVRKQGEELASIKKSRGGSNAIQAEGGPTDAPTEEHVSWPLDMNRPVTRDSVSKTESFFGED